MIIGSNRFINAIDLNVISKITVGVTETEYVTQVKYLGVLITITLDWSNNVTATLNKIRGNLYKLKLCRSLLPEALKIRMVVNLIFPLLDYCCAAFTNMTIEDDLRLQRAINICIRLIYGLRRDEHITLYLRKLKWLRVTSRRHYFILCQFFNMINFS